MTRMVAMFAGLLGVTLVPLALSAPTAWLLLVPAHGLLVSLACTGAVLDGLDGRPEHARRWGWGAVIATAAMIGALQLGSAIRGAGMGYWSAPWLCALATVWVAPLVSAVMGGVGELRRDQLQRRVVRRRRRERARE